MGFYWPSLVSTDEKLWIHEWEKHGYCTSQIVPDVEYFNGAIVFARQVKNMLSVRIIPDNNITYTVANMKKFISEEG